VKLDELGLPIREGERAAFKGMLPGSAGHIVFAWRSSNAGGLLVADRKGGEVWRRELGDGQTLICKSADIDLDGEPEVVALNGEEMFVLDGATGETKAQAPYPAGCPFLHCRGEKGVFADRLPYLQVWMWTDWGSPGIYYLFDTEGNLLHRMQPDARVAVGGSVAWWPDGRQLLLLQGTRVAQGLWDSFGRRVIDLTQPPGLPEAVRPTPTGMPVATPFSVCRFPDASTDRLVTVVGTTFYVLGPDV
jgi:hypothetical protein